MKKLLIAISTLLISLTLNSETDQRYYILISAKDKFERSAIANTDVSIDQVMEDSVLATGSLADLQRFEALGKVLWSGPVIQNLEFPEKDSEYHDYKELVTALEKIHSEFSGITELKSIGKTQEGRDIWSLRISENLNEASTKPGIIFMGGHHAREHLSVETPLRLTQRLLKEYASNNADAKRLIASRDIHIIPAVNPDGLEYDISGTSYKSWRKNRFPNSNGTFGVDLNRNYGFMWGTGGSSANPSSDTYKGTTPFSENETKAIKAYVEANENINILLSFHTFSELILYPWGHKYASIEKEADLKVHQTMAKTMSKSNGYTPQQSSQLYIASGDTTDWSYGQLGIFSFTFELDPKNVFGMGTFYPGDEIIPAVVEKNWAPFMYLIEYSDNPYRVINSARYADFGLRL